MPLLWAYRVQAADGRGPWRPGFSLRWIDAAAPADRLVETVFDLVPMEQLLNLSRSMHWGSACRSLEHLSQWFTPIERTRLQTLGFHPVQLSYDVVLAESPWQMVIGRARPFSDGVIRRRWAG
jgi:hypothetical protein